MATSRAYLAFILEQLSQVDGITYRMMMGEYILYHHGKIAAYVCDDRLLVKILPSTEKLLPDSPKEPPYEGAKDMLLAAVWRKENAWNKRELCLSVMAGST